MHSHPHTHICIPPYPHTFTLIPPHPDTITPSHLTEYISWKELSPCQHHCIAKPTNQLFTLMRDLPDGTPCLHTPPSPLTESLGVCVSGECVSVGCDKVLRESSVRDRCGVWCGNGTTCVPVRDTYTVPTEAHTIGKLLYIYIYTVQQDCIHFIGSNHIRACLPTFLPEMTTSCHQQCLCILQFTGQMEISNCFPPTPLFSACYPSAYWLY